MTVAIVLDPSYPVLEKLVEQMPVWAVDCPRHRALAEQSRRTCGMADALQGITLFKVADESDAEGNLANVIGEVDLHHGIYSSGSRISTLRVIGTTASTRIRSLLAGYGFASFEEGQDGFVAHEMK